MHPPLSHSHLLAPFGKAVSALRVLINVEGLVDQAVLLGQAVPSVLLAQVGQQPRSEGWAVQAWEALALAAASEELALVPESTACRLSPSEACLWC